MPNIVASFFIFILLFLYEILPAAAGTLLHEIKVHDDSIDAICIKDGYVYTGSFDGTIKRTDFTTVEPVGRHRDWVRALLCVDDNIISASNDGRIIIWHDNTIVNQVDAHKWWVTDIAYSNGKIVSVSLDETVKIWSYPDLKLLHQYKIPGSYKHHSVTISDDIAYIGSTTSISLISLKNDKWGIRTINFATFDTYYSGTTSRDYIYFSDSAGNIHQCDASLRKMHNVKSIGNYAIKTLQQHSDTLYAATDSGQIHKIAIPEFKQAELFDEHPQAIRTIRVTDNALIAAYNDGFLRAFSLSK